MVRSIFLRGIAAIYLIAFASLLPQIDGLIGSHGILPANHYLEAVHSEYGSGGYLLFPTLAWLNSSDVFLHAMVWAGIALSLALLAGVIPIPATIGLYVLYLSMDTIGQTFFSFQWDALLLETGFAAIVIAPWGLRPSYTAPPGRTVVWLFRLLIFRLMLESGTVKLLSGDSTWRNLTALQFHYETQPLPTPLAWYAHHLPGWFQRVSVFGVFVVELAIPVLFLTTRRLRRIGACATIAFQLLIALTGNYTFFNLLTIVLCIPLFFDFRAMAPQRARPSGALRSSEYWEGASSVNAAILIVFGLLQLSTTLGIWRRVPEPLASIEYRLATFQVVNGYGLFANMTTSRPEIIIEGSDDGNEWKAYEFKYKPGDVSRPLPWVAPYQPRLDWQMWFAALSNYESNPWFSQLMLHLLEGSPEVLNLLATNPFPDKPPHYVRATSYDYHFSDSSTRKATGAIWTRTPTRTFFPPVSLR